MTDIYNESEELSLQEQKDELEYERSLIEEPIMRKAFNMWRQFTKDRIEEQIKDDMVRDVDHIERFKSTIKWDVIDTLEDLYKENNKLDWGMSNVLIEETINKLKEALENIETISLDVHRI